MKNVLISDLHKILFCTQLESCPDNWDILVSMAKCFLTHHEVTFKTCDEIPDSHYWNYPYAKRKSENSFLLVEEKFFDTVCPGKVPSVTAFGCTCEAFMALDVWEELLPIRKDISNALNLAPAIEALKQWGKERPYQVVAVIGTHQQLTEDNKAA